MKSDLWRHPDSIFPTGRNSRLSPRHRAYVVGDIHGRMDLLRPLYDEIIADIRKSIAPAGQSTNNAANTAPEVISLVFLGDYIDRGPDSATVIEFLSNLEDNAEGIDKKLVFIRGNHEQFLLDFLFSQYIDQYWLPYCRPTCASYGVQLPEEITQKNSSIVSRRLFQQIPEKHVRFLENTQLHHQIGDFLFVHAGIKPSATIEEQAPNDLLTIREPFLSHNKALTKVIVHGHSTSEAVKIYPHRIGVDTGAFYSGVLSCLVLEDDNKRVIQAISPLAKRLDPNVDATVWEQENHEFSKSVAIKHLPLTAPSLASNTEHSTILPLDHTGE